MWSKRWILNYLLFVLIIMFTWIGMKYPIDGSESAQTSPDRLTSIRPPDVTRIRVETADGHLLLERDATRWMLQEPIAWFANNIAVERLTGLAGFEYQSKLPDDQIDLSTLGLTLPKAVVTLNQQAIAFGATNQIGNRRYLLSDNQVYLVSDLHYPLLNLGVAGFSDKRLLPPGLDTTRLQLVEREFVREEGEWSSSNSDDSVDQISQILSAWQRGEASAIKPYDRTLTPLNRISAQTDRGEIEFFLLAIRPEIIIARPDLELQYHFPDHQYYELLAPPPEGS